MCNKEQLVGYLYDDLSGADRAAFEAHVMACPECEAELVELRSVRHHLSAWAPAEPELDFRIVRGASPAPRPRVFVPGWALAAAASVLLLAGAAGLANIEVRYGPDGFTLRTGWASTAAAAPVASGSAQAPVQAGAVPAASELSEDLRVRLAALAERLEALETSQQTQMARESGSVRPGVTGAELRRVLAETEARHRTEMALQIAQIWRDFNAARASDFVRVQQTITPELQRQQRSIENLYRVSLQK